MKLFHLSDLHIGKMLGSYDIADIQLDVFNQIIEAVRTEKPDAIIIAGDVYDKSAPSGDAFDLFNVFLNMLGELSPRVPAFIISGNHDSNLRLNYASSFLEKQEIYVAATVPMSEEDHLKKVTLTDECGAVNFYLMPFVKPADAKNLFGEDKQIITYDEAFAAILEREEVDYAKRNVLVAHQFFVGSGTEPVRRDSEMRYISVGGIDSVDVSHVVDFDYVALGHIHTAQKIGKEHIRYSGTPVKYSLSEVEDSKGITVVELGDKGTEPVIGFIPLKMKYDLRKLRGTFAEITAMANDEIKKDFVSITLTDEEAILDVKNRLLDFYDRVFDVTYDNPRTRALLTHDCDESFEDDIPALFNEFFTEQNGRPVNEKEQEIMLDVISKIMEWQN